MVGHLLDPLSRREQNSYQVLFFCMNFHLTITPNVPRPREDPIDHGVCRSHESQVRLRQLVGVGAAVLDFHASGIRRDLLGLPVDEVRSG